MGASFLESSAPTPDRVHEHRWGTRHGSARDATPGLYDHPQDLPISCKVGKDHLASASQPAVFAGHPDGFEITLDTLNETPYPEIAQSIQATLAQAGITANIQTAEGKTLWPMYRARKH